MSSFSVRNINHCIPLAVSKFQAKYYALIKSSGYKTNHNMAISKLMAGVMSPPKVRDILS